MMRSRVTSTVLPSRGTARWSLAVALCLLASGCMMGASFTVPKEGMGSDGDDAETELTALGWAGAVVGLGAIGVSLVGVLMQNPKKGMEAMRAGTKTMQDELARHHAMDVERVRRYQAFEAQQAAAVQKQKDETNARAESWRAAKAAAQSGAGTTSTPSARGNGPSATGATSTSPAGPSSTASSSSTASTPTGAGQASQQGAATPAPQVGRQCKDPPTIDYQAVRKLSGALLAASGAQNQVAAACYDFDDKDNCERAKRECSDTWSAYMSASPYASLVKEMLTTMGAPFLGKDAPSNLRMTMEDPGTALSTCEASGKDELIRRAQINFAQAGYLNHVVEAWRHWLTWAEAQTNMCRTGKNYGSGSLHF